MIQLYLYAPIPTAILDIHSNLTLLCRRHSDVAASQEEGNRLPAVGFFYGGFLSSPRGLGLPATTTNQNAEVAAGEQEQIVACLPAKHNKLTISPGCDLAAPPTLSAGEAGIENEQMNV